jgi:N12 class adenine-specific DNA methylase
METLEAKLRARLNTRMDEDRKDMVIPFEELGIDQIFVDEAHKFKNLAFHTKITNVAGLSFKASKRAEDMYLKTQYLSESRNGGGVVFATGTPIANTMGEMFNLQRYLAYDSLQEQGLGHFDAWAAMFGQTTSDFEMTASGNFKQRTRFAQFNNVPELLQQFFTFADVKTASMLDLPKPSIVNRYNVAVPMSPAQKDYMQALVARAQNMKNMKPHEDNFLKLTTDGMKMAVDLRLVQAVPDDPGSKINTAINQVIQIYKDKSLSERIGKNGKPIGKHVQLVFMDIGTPKSESKKTEDDEGPVKTTAQALDKLTAPEDEEFSALYKEMKEKLIRQGVPAE